MSLPRLVPSRSPRLRMMAVIAGSVLIICVGRQLGIKSLRRHHIQFQSAEDKGEKRQHVPNYEPRIKFKLRRDLSREAFLEPSRYPCPSAKIKMHLPEAMAIPGLFDFETSVETNLHILFLGDSVGIQFHQRCQEAAGIRVSRAVAEAEGIRNLLKYIQNKKECITAGRVNGGGVVAGFRLTGMFARKAKDQPPPPAKGGGWLQKDVHQLLNHSFILATTNNETENKTVGSFDTLVFRIPQDWIPISNVTAESLQETIEVAHEAYGVKSVVFVTLPIIPNYSSATVAEMRGPNKVIRELAAKWTMEHAQVLSGVEHVMALEFGEFTLELMEWQGRLLGFNTTTDDYLLNNKARTPATVRPVPAVWWCETPPEKGVCKLAPPFIADGQIHWCMETFGGRISAGISCLIGCAHNHPRRSAAAVVECSRECNSKFMTLRSIDSTEILGNLHTTTTYPTTTANATVILTNANGVK
jgi:hypothetical protein